MQTIRGGGCFTFQNIAALNDNFAELVEWMETPTFSGDASFTGGTACGNPTGTITVAVGAATGLTASVRYAYSEIDPTGGGETALSPISATLVLVNQKANITVPLPRRGMGGRILYRSDNGDPFKRVRDLNSDSFYQTGFVDFLANGSLGPVAPTEDTTVLYNLEVSDGVKFFRTHPDQGGNPADVGVVTGDPYTQGAYSMDIYGEVFIRSVLGANIGLLKTGLNGNMISGFFNPATDDDTDPTLKFAFDPAGSLRIYNTWTNGGADNEHVVFRWVGDEFNIAAQEAGSGVLRTVRLSGNQVTLAVNGVDKFYANASGALVAPAIPALSGQRYLQIDANGVITSSTSAPVGT